MVKCIHSSDYRFDVRPEWFSAHVIYSLRKLLPQYLRPSAPTLFLKRKRTQRRGFVEPYVYGVDTIIVTNMCPRLVSVSTLPHAKRVVF